MTDQDFLKLATEEGKKGSPPHLYGAVVVVDGDVIAVEHNHVWERHDPSAHAEVTAIKAACKQLGNHNLQNATLYASHQPCVMCFVCAAWADFDRIVYAQPASEISDDSYEFAGLSLKDLADKLTRPMKVELVRINQ